MHTARRIYLYLVTYVSLLMLLAGAANLLRLLGELALGTTVAVVDRSEYLRGQFSLWGAALLVGTLVWAIHWWLGQRAVVSGAPGAAEERRAVLRKLLLYAVLATALWQVLFAASALLQSFLLALPGPGVLAFRLTLAAAVPPLAVYGLAWWYYWRARTADAAATPERGGAATVARWYTYLVAYTALSVAMWAGAGLAGFAWRLLADRAGALPLAAGAVPGPVARYAAWLVPAAAIWAWHWWRAQRLAAAAAEERRAALRQVYLYGAILQAVAVTLTDVAFALYRVLQSALGDTTALGAEETLLGAAGASLLAALVYGVFWAYHRQALGRDATLAAAPPRQAAIRRLYGYLVALVGLVVLAVGAADLLRLLLDLGLGGATRALGRSAWADEISFCVTLVVVGGPVWLLQWLRLQRAALAPDGAAERQSIFRRISLFLVLLAGMLTLLTAAAVAVYRLLLRFGATMAAADRAQLSWALGAGVTAGVLLAYHLRQLLADQRARAAAAPPPPAGATTALLLVGGADAAALDEALRALAGALPAGATLATFPVPGVASADVRDWLAGRPAPTNGPRPPALAGPPAGAGVMPGE